MFEKIDIAICELEKYGINKVSCKIIKNTKKEINVEAGKITLMRSTIDSSFIITAITKEGALGTTTINSLLDEDIKKAANKVFEIAKASKADEANDISSFEEGPCEFEFGPINCDENLFYDRVWELMEYIKKEYPAIQLDVVFGFENKYSWYKNTNNVKFQTQRGNYEGYAIFTAKEENRSSSMCMVEFYLNDLKRPLIEISRFKDLLDETVKHINPRSINDKFIGDVVFAPEMVSEFVNYFKSCFLSDNALITGTSVLRDKLNEKIISDLVTINEDVEESKVYFTTLDGFRAKNETFIKDGVLKKYGLTLYGEKKTRIPRALSSGILTALLPGGTALSDLIKGVKRGVLLCRFSGGSPNENGDFSGVCKNSFYIENGEILYPISETMISGNLLEIFKNVDAVSKEVSGNDAVKNPWIRSKGINIISV